VGFGLLGADRDSSYVGRKSELLRKKTGGLRHE
jgi:hypothetical protein